MFTRSHDLRSALSRGSRHWQLLALPTTFAFAVALLINGNGPQMAPPTAALIDISNGSALRIDATTSDGPSLLFIDHSRRANASLPTIDSGPGSAPR